jgi:hypothetical protein
MIAASRELTGRAGNVHHRGVKIEMFSLGVFQKCRKCHLINR